ncbi:MFS transporter [uncultured Methanocorpusculum sp.]|nr:MFS transporter [uncultured Methanocorpusculum sp.]
MNISRIAVYLGAFAAMALSNAVVPVLALITSDAAVQGAVYSAYFLGAFFMVFPAGWVSDKIGRAPLIKIGLAGTFASGLLIWLFTGDPLLTVGFRFLEGLFTGMFVSSSLSYVNSQIDHTKLSGMYLALMNVGMVAGLVIPGILAVIQPYAGVLVFSVLTGSAFLAGVFFREDPGFVSVKIPVRMIFSIALYHKWLWAALFIFTGATGVVISMYPEMSGYSAEISGVVTALMSVSTAVCIYAVSRFSLQDSLGFIRRAAFILAVSVPLVFFTPIGMILVGAVFGVISVAVLNYIAGTPHPQGMMNGLLTTMQYAGMAALPFFTGLIVFPMGYLGVFILVGALVLLGGLLIVRCPCYASALKKSN